MNRSYKIFTFLTAIIFSLFFAEVGHASNFWLEVGTDLRNVGEIVDDDFSPMSGSSSEGNDLNSDTGRRVRGKAVSIRPTIRVGYERRYKLNETVSLASSIAVSNAYGKVTYPSGKMFGRLNVVEPITIKVNSLDLSLEQSIMLFPVEGWTIGASVSFKSQYIDINTKFGSWNLQDNIQSNHFVGSVWIDRSAVIFDKAFVRFKVAHVKDDPSYSISLRQLF